MPAVLICLQIKLTIVWQGRAITYVEHLNFLEIILILITLLIHIFILINLLL